MRSSKLLKCRRGFCRARCGSLSLRFDRTGATGIIQAFRRERGKSVERLDRWKGEDFARTAIHPRLQQPMRDIDVALFVAEHDDHHLAVMTELARRFAAPTKA